ncbi:MAG: MFS transporter [Holophaga sp.]|nr:MFS transporter [Holophaga sp.]
MTPEPKPDPRRWIVLASYMLFTMAVEGQWVALTPVARPAERFYGAQIHPGSLFGVDFLAMIFLLTYLVGSVPASRVLGNAGLRRGLAVGALLGGAGALLKAFGAFNFWVVLAGQVLLGLGQPFVLNAATTLGARWFPMGERALAVGLATLAQFLGIAGAMILGPMLVVGDAGSAAYGSGVAGLLRVHGAFTVAAGLLCLALVREPRASAEALAPQPRSASPLRDVLRCRDFQLTLVLFAIGLGILNALSGMEDAVAAHIGAVDSDGMLGACLIGGGIVGALILPALSDHFRRRRPFLILGLCGMVPGVAGMAWAGRLAPDPAAAYLLAKIAAGWFGFFLIGGGSIGFQFAAEITHPAPEAASQGLLLLAGQVTGILFMVMMSQRTLLGPTLLLFTVLAALSGAATWLLKESPLARGQA